jgi:hypothetical protein
MVVKCGLCGFRIRIKMLEMWCYQRMLKIRWYDHITSELVSRRVGETHIFGGSLEVRRRDRLVGLVLRHLCIVGLIIEDLV